MAFNRHAARLLDAQHPNSTYNFIQFVLAGLYIANDGKYRRVHIEPAKDTQALQDMPIVITRDFDSLIGITEDLPFLEPISIFPVPNFHDCMNKSNHLKRYIRQPVSHKPSGITLVVYLLSNVDMERGT